MNLLLVFSLTGQTQLVVEADADNGPQRNLVTVHNIASGSHASTGFSFRSGSGVTERIAGISITNSLYTAIPNINGALNITSGSSTTLGSGINFRAVSPGAEFRYYLGGFFDANIKMVFDANANLGINNASPMSRLHVSDGDVYIDDVNSGVIMHAPDGNCWRLTVDDLGNIVTTAIACP